MSTNNFRVNKQNSANIRAASGPLARFAKLGQLVLRLGLPLKNGCALILVQEKDNKDTGRQAFERKDA